MEGTKVKNGAKIQKLSFESKIDLFRNRLGTGPKMTVPVPVLGWPEPRVTRNRLTSLQGIQISKKVMIKKIDSFLDFDWRVLK